MSHEPDPFAPPSGSTPASVGGPAGPPVAMAARVPAQPAYGACATPGVSSGWTPAPSVPGGLATASIVLACVWTVVQVVAFALSFSAAEEYGRAVAVGSPVFDVFTPYDGVTSLLGAVQVAAFVVTCLWLQRGREVAAAISPDIRPARRPVWVWLGWIVPVVSLWFPYQVVRDVRSGATGLRKVPGPALWWTCWLVMMWATKQTTITVLGSSWREPAWLPGIEGIGTVATVVGLVTWIRIVREVTAAQRSRLELPAPTI